MHCLKTLNTFTLACQYTIVQGDNTKHLNYIDDVTNAFSTISPHYLKPFESNLDGGVNYASMILPVLSSMDSLHSSNIVIDTFTEYCTLAYPKLNDRVGINVPFIGYLHEVPLENSIIIRLVLVEKESIISTSSPSCSVIDYTVNVTTQGSFSTLITHPMNIVDGSIYLNDIAKNNTDVERSSPYGTYCDYIIHNGTYEVTLLYQDDLGNEPYVYPNYTKIRFDNKTEMPFIESVTNRSVIYTTYKNADAKNAPSSTFTFTMHLPEDAMKDTVRVYIATKEYYWEETKTSPITITLNEIADSNLPHTKGKHQFTIHRDNKLYWKSLDKNTEYEYQLQINDGDIVDLYISYVDIYNNARRFSSVYTFLYHPKVKTIESSVGLKDKFVVDKTERIMVHGKALGVVQGKRNDLFYFTKLNTCNNNENANANSSYHYTFTPCNVNLSSSASNILYQNYNTTECSEGNVTFDMHGIYYMCMKPDYNGIFTGYKYELVEDYTATVSGLIECTKGCTNTPVISVTGYEEVLNVKGFGLSNKDRIKWIPEHEHCNADDYTMLPFNTSVSTSDKIYGEMIELDKIITTGTATANGQMEEDGVIRFTIHNETQSTLKLKMCYSFENEPFYQLTTLKNESTYKYKLYVHTIETIKNHDTLLSTESVNIASMTFPKYFIIDGIGLTNQDTIKWTKSSTICDDTTFLENTATYQFMKSDDIIHNGIRLNITFINHFNNERLYMCYNYKNDLAFIHVKKVYMNIVSLTSVSNAFATTGLAKWTYANGNSNAILQTFSPNVGSTNTYLKFIKTQTKKFQLIGQGLSLVNDKIRLVYTKIDCQSKITDIEDYKVIKSTKHVTYQNTEVQEMFTFEYTFNKRPNNEKIMYLCYQHTGLEYKVYSNIQFKILEVLTIDEVSVVANVDETLTFTGVDLSTNDEFIYVNANSNNCNIDKIALNVETPILIRKDESSDNFIGTIQVKANTGIKVNKGGIKLCYSYENEAPLLLTIGKLHVEDVRKFDLINDTEYSDRYRTKEQIKEYHEEIGYSDFNNGPTHIIEVTEPDSGNTMSRLNYKIKISTYDEDVTGDLFYFIKESENKCPDTDLSIYLNVTDEPNIEAIFFENGNVIYNLCYIFNGRIRPSVKAKPVLYRQDPTLKIITTCGVGFANTNCRRCPSTTFTKRSVTVCNAQGYCDGSGTSRSTSAIGYVDGFNPIKYIPGQCVCYGDKDISANAQNDDLEHKAREVGWTGTTCEDCIQPWNPATNCESCSFGYAHPGVENTYRCNRCANGWFGDGDPTQSGCDFCPTLDIFKDEAEEIYARDNVSESVACSRKGTCTPPEAGASGANQTATCTCSPSSGFEGDDCSLCAPGFNAQGIMQCLQCPYPERCPGGPEPRCSCGYMGPTCEDCSRGKCRKDSDGKEYTDKEIFDTYSYTHNPSKGFFTLAGRCHPCPEGVGFTVLIIGILFVIIFLILYTILLLAATKMNLAPLAEFFNHIQMMSFYFDIPGIKWPTLFHLTMPDIMALLAAFGFGISFSDVASPQCFFPNFGYREKWLIGVGFPAAFIFVTLLFFHSWLAINR
jgi:hypothetical protein